MNSIAARPWPQLLVATALVFGCGSPAKPAAKPTAPAGDTGEVAAESAAPELPAASEILERYIEVTGGRAAYEKMTSSVATGQMAMPAMNLAGPVTVYMAAPRKLYFKVSIPGVADQERGTDGELAWEKATMTGNRIVEGKELAAMMREATFNADLEWQELYAKAETVALEEVNGKPAYKVVMTTPEATTETRFYNQASGLLVRTTMNAETNMGVIPVEVMVSDYRDVGGVKVPFKNTSKMMGMEQVLTLDKVEVNVDIPADRFAIPAEIETLRARPADPAPAGPAAKP